MKLEKRVSTFADDPKLSCDAALKKMYSLLEKYASFPARDLFTMNSSLRSKPLLDSLLRV